ncbi:hypothetical protein KIPB_011855, partial [Kipferlia bialata]
DTVNVGNALYRAPECIEAGLIGHHGYHQDTPQYGTSADIFAAGLIFGKLLQPHSWILGEAERHGSRAQLYGCHTEGRFDHHLTDDITGVPGLAGIINPMVQMTPGDRPTAAQVLAQLDALLAQDQQH